MANRIILNLRVLRDRENNGLYSASNQKKEARDIKMVFQLPNAVIIVAMFLVGWGVYLAVQNPEKTVKIKNNIKKIMGKT